MVKKIGLFTGPLLFVLLLLIPKPDILTEDMWKVLACTTWIIIWWFTEAVPIAATALLPIILFPVVNVSDIKEVVIPYAHNIIFLFMGGFLLAIGMEKHNLHQRIALNILKLTGTKSNQIILGFMITTGVLSMWVSNTATTVMMLPIALSVINLVGNPDDGQNTGVKNFALSLLLGIAFAANIGGTGTIIGTPPNVVLVSYLEDSHNITISFLQWMKVGVPFAVILITLSYLTLVHIIYPNNIGDFKSTGTFIDKRISALGTPKKGEIGVFFVFLTTVLMWVFRGQLNDIIPFPISDSMIAMFGGLLMFIIPTDWEKNERILNWEDTKKLPWGILILFGGGLSLAAAMKKTGLVELVGSQISQLGISWVAVVVILVLFMIFMTELMSNVALTTIFLPVVAGIAMGMGESIYLPTIAVTLAASCAFMLPMATPPNAIIFSSGMIKIPQMAKAGFLINLIAAVVILIFGKFLIEFVF